VERPEQHPQNVQGGPAQGSARRPGCGGGGPTRLHQPRLPVGRVVGGNGSDDLVSATLVNGHSSGVLLGHAEAPRPDEGTHSPPAHFALDPARESAGWSASTLAVDEGLDDPSGTSGLSERPPCGAVAVFGPGAAASCESPPSRQRHSTLFMLMHVVASFLRFPQRYGAASRERAGGWHGSTTGSGMSTRLVACSPRGSHYEHAGSRSRTMLACSPDRRAATALR
jgi:hypothetical protein